MSDLVRFSSGDNDVAKRTQVDPQNPTAKFVPLEPGQVLFGLEVIEDGSLLGTIYYDYKDKNGIITRVNMGNGGVGGAGGGGIIKTLATTDGKHDGEEVTAAANVVIPLPKKIFADLLSAKTQFNFPKVHDSSNANYVNEDAAPGQSYLYGNGLHMVNPFNTLQDSWIRTIGTKGSAEATLELAMRDNASSEYIYDQIVARHYKADGTVVTDKNGRKREVVILGKNGESQFPGPVTSDGGFVGDVAGNATSATKAKNDWYDQVIDSTYLSKVIKTAHDGSKFEITSYDGRYTPVGANEAKKDVITIPGATTSAAGLVTTGAQTFTGNKTINSSGSLTIQKEGGFVYSGILEDKASNSNLPIWFATGGTNGTPKYSTELTYNPSTGTVTAKKFAGPAISATYDAEGGAIHDKYLKRAGGTMTGALNFADNTYNAFGDDVEIGSKDAKGKLSIHGKNDATGIVFVPYSGTVSQTISIDGAGVMTITGTLKATLDGNASTATKLQTARAFHITDSSATYNGANVSFDGTGDVTLHMPSTFAGSLKGNADTATKLATARTLWGQSFNGSANVTGAMSNVGNITSLKTNTHDIGSSSNVWKNIYATTFHGALDGKATSAGSADMANQVTHVLTIEGQSYDGSTDVAVGNTVFYIVGNLTDATAGTWTGTDTRIKSYYNGLTIIYVPKVDGASTTTLNLNNLGAKTCYYSNTSKLTTHFAKGTPILLTYIDGYWRRADYDSNTNTQVRVYRQVTSDSSYNGEYPLLVSRTKASGIGTAGTNNSYTSVYGVMSNDTTKIPTVNVHTGTITATSFKGVATNAMNDVNGNKIDETYVKLAGDTMTGSLTTPTLNLSSTSGVGHLNFSRASVNYITAPASGYFAFVPNGLSVGVANSSLLIAATSVYPGATDKISLGTTSYKWKNVYATTFTGALDGNAATATKLQTARSFHITDPSVTYNGASVSFDGTADVTLHMPSTFTGHLKGNAENDGNGVNIASNYMRSEAITGNIDEMQAALAGKTGRTGSISLTKKGSGTGSQVPAGWYNYIFSPHRTGIGGDNDSYGTTLLFPMTFSGDTYIVRRQSRKDAATEVKTIIDSGNIGKQSVDNADKVDGYHASSLWRSDGAVWNPGANVSMTGAANGQEWSFDIHKGGMTGLYWQVWEDSKATLLKVDADTGKVSAPYGFVGDLTGNASSATKLLTNGRHAEAASNNDTSVWVNKNGMLYTSGMYMTETYSDANTPAAYGNIINLAGGGAGQLLLEWTSSTATGHIYYRDQRDVAGSGDWHSWQKVAFVTDNVASADKWATSRNFQVDLALDNPATVKVDGTKDVILPVTGVLATKHGGTGNSAHTKNRLVWSEEATKLSATNNHYASASQIAVNSASAPTGYTFLVNGKTHLNGDTRVTGNILMTTSSSCIHWDNDTYQQRILTTDDSTVDTAVFTFQQTENKSTWNNLLTIRDNGRIILQNDKGGIYKLVTTANTSPLIQLVSDDQDVSIFKVAHGTAITDSWSCGFDLKYIGTGSGVHNLLTLYAGDYANTQTQVVGWSVNQAGQMGIKTTPNTSYSLTINGNTYSNGKFYINHTSDASLSGDGAIVIGPTSGENLTIDTNEIMARNNKAASTLYLNDQGGLVQIGSGGLYVTGQIKTNGPLLVGSDVNGRGNNYIAFFGTTGDGVTSGTGAFNHSYIGENIYGGTECSELLIYKGNDPGGAPEDMRYANGAGPDRIRHIAAGHLFQIYRSALSGTFTQVAQSAAPISIFEVNQQGVVVYNEGTDANNYPAKITFRVKDTVNGTTSTATIAAYSDHGTSSYGSNLVISSGGNTLIQAGDGTYGGYANLIGSGVNQGENLYLTADGSIQLCAIADTSNRKLIWDGTTFYPSISNTFHLGSKSYRWASAHVYRDFNIYGTESTGDESHVRFNASDNSQRAIIAFNGNTTNTLDATTHLKIATNYGDIRLDAASNYINVKGHILPRADFTATNYNIGSTTRRWGNVYANALRLQGPASDPSEAQGARIEFAYDNGTTRSQPVYISYTPNDSYRAPYGLKVFGTETGNYGAWLEVQGAIGTSNTNASSGIGLSLYGGPVNGKPAYGMFFGGTATFGKLYNTTSSTYGVSSDWATYFTMSDTTNRGWLFMRGATNVAGVTGNGTFLSVVSTGTHIAGNQGKVIIDGTAGAGYNMLFRQKSTNGVFTAGAYNAEWNLYYTANSVITAGTNGTSYGIRLINEAGNTRLNRLGINGENTGYQLYVNGTSYYMNKLYFTADTCIIQNQASTSNSTTAIKWYKGGTSQNTYDPSISQHNTGGDGTGSITILPYPTATSPWGGTVGLFIQKGKMLLDGQEVFTANSYSTLDNRYLKYNGWWTSGNGSNVNNASGMIFCYANHGAPTGWGILTTFDYQLNSSYRTQFFTQGYDCIPYIRTHSADRGAWTSWKRMWCQGDAVTSAVWNDYAECRKADTQEPGYVMFEVGDDSLAKTTRRLQPFAGIISDTWGFSQGETEDAKTNIAVAGRVLAYPYQDRNNYKPGDCVCAAPNGTVDIMSREEVIRYPDRIVGTVSCVPDYEEWGGGENADRKPVKVNGRIWIKVK